MLTFELPKDDFDAMLRLLWSTWSFERMDFPVEEIILDDANWMVGQISPQHRQAVYYRWATSQLNRA